nr:unnamed protein product [Naegleria fowleri]
MTQKPLSADSKPFVPSQRIQMMIPSSSSSASLIKPVQIGGATGPINLESVNDESEHHSHTQSSFSQKIQNNKHDHHNKHNGKRGKNNKFLAEQPIRNSEFKDSDPSNMSHSSHKQPKRKGQKSAIQNSQMIIPSVRSSSQQQLSNAGHVQSTDELPPTNVSDLVHAHQYSQNFPSVSASISSSSSTATSVPFSYKDILQSKPSGILTNSEILPQKSVVIASHSNHMQPTKKSQPHDSNNNYGDNGSANNNTIAPTTQTKETNKSEVKAKRKQSFENATNNNKPTALKPSTTTDSNTTAANVPTTPQKKLTKKQRRQLLINSLLQERKEFTLADHIGGDIDQLLKNTKSTTSSSSTIPSDKTKLPKESPKKQGKKDETTASNKKSISKMNALEKALFTKGDMKGRKPIRLEIYSDKVTNEDVYKAFMLAVNQPQTGQSASNSKDTENASTSTTHDEKRTEEMLVAVATKKKKPNKLKKIILKEKEIRKLQNLSPTDFIDVKKYLKKQKQAETTEEETSDDNVIVIEIERDHHDISSSTIVDEHSEHVKSSMEGENASSSTMEHGDSNNPNMEDTNDYPNEASEESDSESVISETESMNIVLKGATERKIREYVPYPLDPIYENCVFQMLAKLQFYQHRLKKTDKKKFKARRRYVIGIREVLKGLKIKEIRAVVIAPNIDKITTPGGLDSKIEEIIQKCNEMELPVFFALTKKKLGIALKTSTKISVVGLYSMDGAFDEFKKAKAMIEEKLEQKKESSSQPMTTTTTTSSE